LPGIAGQSISATSRKMNFELKLKLIGYFLTILLIANLLLFSFTIISWKVFLLVLAVIGAVSYFGIPLFRKRIQQPDS
jgi:hypothetical protein